MKLNERRLCGTEGLMSFPGNEGYLQVASHPKLDPTRVHRDGTCTKGSWIEFLDSADLAVVL